MCMRLVVNMGLGDSDVNDMFDKMFGSNGIVPFRDLEDCLRKRFTGYTPLEVLDHTDPKLILYKKAGFKMYELKDGIVYQSSEKVRGVLQVI